MRLQGKTAIVTGAASGLGRAMAQALAREGANVVVADVNAAGGEATAAGIRAAGGQAAFVACDVAQAAQVEAMVRACVARFGPPDVLCANAGIELMGRDAKAHELSEEIWERTHAVNLKGLWLSCKYALIEMLKLGRGSVIITGSPTGLYGIGAGEAAYSSSKAGVHGLMRVMAADYARSGIRVNCIVPGYMDTPINAPVLPDAAARREAGEAIPIGRLGQPEDIGGLAVFLASDESSYCTGAFFTCDGGQTAV